MSKTSPKRRCCQGWACPAPAYSGPHTPEDRKPPAVKETPRAAPKAKPIGKAQPSLGAPAPIFSTGAPRRDPLTLFNPYPSSSFPSGSAPAPQGPPPAPVITPAQPPAPSTVKVDHPDAFKGKIGSEAKQWLTRPQLPPHEHGGSRRGLAHPHLDQLGSHRALIQTVDEFKTEFLAAFGDPDATRAAERKITSLTQTGTCAEYITKFRTLQMELDWNDAALRGQFAGTTLGGSPTNCHEGEATPTGQQATKTGPLSSDPNYVLEEERNRRRAEGLCVKCGKPGHKFAECRTGWKATPKEDKGRPRKPPKSAKTLSPNREKKICHVSTASKTSPLFTISIQPKQAEPIEVLIDSGATSSFLHPRTAELLRLPLIDLPSPRTVTMLDGIEMVGRPQPRNRLNARTLSFPHAPPEHMAIAEEEEADKDPLEGVPPEYHQYAKIRPSKSSISSPVMFVPKKDGSRQLVVDYRRLNNRTKKNVYPLPRPDDLMAQLRGAKVFTKLDLRWGYNNVRVKEGDEWKTAFRTKYGLYESLHFMNKLFKDLLDVCVIIYLDDILIYSKDDATHTQHVHEVLQRLMENQLFCKASKCTFHVTSVEYLGIIVSDKGFSLDKLKIQAVQEWPVPTKVKEVQSFLGFAISSAALSPTSVTWLGRSILSQRQEDGRLHPLGFLSESFKGAEQNYDTHDKELLAIIRSFEYWRIFLEGTAHPVTVFTDHRNLEYWKESRTFNRRHARWHLLLAGYNFQIVYRPGKQSGKPDALSRRADHANIPPAAQTMLPNPVFANVALVTPEKELQRQIEAALDQDESLEEILQFLQNESKAPPQLNVPSKITKWKLGCYFTKDGLYPLAGHPGRQRTLELMSRNYYWPGIRADTYWHVDSCETCQRIRKPKYASIPPQPLELPIRPWQHVSYDMIVDLPKDGNNDSILVIVDSFTKYVILVECSKKLKAPELADLFLRHVWKRYDPHFSSAYHPQSDGQTERVNPTVEHFLRAYSGINQKDWVKWLPMAEFAYNNAVHSSTGKSPFKALQSSNSDGSAMAGNRGRPPAIKNTHGGRRSGRTLEFEIGEEAWLDAKNVKLKTLSPKLTEQRLGPFKVTERISDRAYRLELPPTMRIHDVFYVGLLSKVKRDKRRNFENQPPPVTVDGEEEYEVEGITDMEERNGKWFFRVKWKGYGSKENTWEPRENLKNAEKILEKFEKEMKKKALGAAKALRGGAVL
ncbi:hypothetical protein RHS01_08513 [Rhizoctonia solani]|uniref:RNA-directed DNA polymerase n=1 Tax=Rhizoctonia solani TaxID=456999 RepID=A0A8H7M498_9AGAM|nr:hypothetical protein RHS01_08513 [Rhizoctonia solani]